MSVIAPVEEPEEGLIQLREEMTFTFEGLMHKEIQSNRCAEALISKVKNLKYL